MSDDEETTDINPTHFAKRDSDRGDKGYLVRIFESLDPAAQQELLRFAEALGNKAKRS